MTLHEFEAASLPFVRALDTICVRAGYSQVKAYAQIAAESGFDPKAVSAVGAIGLCQIMPTTAVGWGIDPTDPAQSMFALVRSMKAYEEEFGSFALALAAYNAGPGVVETYGGVPPYSETQAYVQTITAAVDAALASGDWVPYWESLLSKASASPDSVAAFPV